MAWYDRIRSAAGNVARSIGRAFTGRRPSPAEPPPTGPVTQGVYEPPYEPVPPPPAAPPPPVVEEAPMVPTEEGVWITAEEPTGAEYQGDEFNVYDPENFETLQRGTWVGDSFVPDRPQPYMTMDDWHRESLLPADVLRARYSWANRDQIRPNIEIIKQLEAAGYYITIEQWAEEYEALVYAI